MHDVRARSLQPEDVADEQRVLIKHGAGYVEGTIRNVKRTPVERRENHSGPVLETDEKVSYGLFSDTGFETSGNFFPHWEHEPRVVNGVERPANIPERDPRRVLVADPEGPIIAEVADMIGSSSRLYVHVPGVDPAKAEALIIATLQAAGIEVWSAHTRIDSEQRVDILDIDDKVIAHGILESQGSTVATGGAYKVNYLPYGDTRSFRPALSQSTS